MVLMKSVALLMEQEKISMQGDQNESTNYFINVRVVIGRWMQGERTMKPNIGAIVILLQQIGMLYMSILFNLLVQKSFFANCWSVHFINP